LDEKITKLGLNKTVRAWSILDKLMKDDVNNIVDIDTDINNYHIFTEDFFGFFDEEKTTDDDFWKYLKTIMAFYLMKFIISR
jgi:hypothetical protein